MSLYDQWKMVTSTNASATCPDTARIISALWLERINIPDVVVAASYYAAWQRDRRERSLLYCGFRAASDIMAGIAAIPDSDLMREVLREKTKWVLDVTTHPTQWTGAIAYILRPTADTLRAMIIRDRDCNFTALYEYLRTHPEEDPAFIREAEKQLNIYAWHLYPIQDHTYIDARVRHALISNAIAEELELEYVHVHLSNYRIMLATENEHVDYAQESYDV